HHRACIESRRRQAPATSGSKGTGIQPDVDGHGTTDTGRCRRTRARTGSRRTTKADGTSPAAGKAVAVTSSTIIGGTASGGVTNVESRVASAVDQIASLYVLPGRGCATGPSGPCT